MSAVGVKRRAWSRVAGKPLKTFETVVSLGGVDSEQVGTVSKGGLQV